jgi:hypothetical protein
MAVQQRFQDLQRHRGAYITPGPNFIWSIDGYLKLAPYVSGEVGSMAGTSRSSLAARS